MGLVSDGIALHFARLLATAGQAVTYRRGQTAVSLTAVAGQSEHEADSDAGIITVQTKDWICGAAALGALAPPAIGDRVEQTIGEDLMVYEVIGPAGRACYEFSDANHAMVRVHTQLIDVQ